MKSLNTAALGNADECFGSVQTKRMELHRCVLASALKDVNARCVELALDDQLVSAQALCKGIEMRLFRRHRIEEAVRCGRCVLRIACRTTSSREPQARQMRT